MLSIVSHKLIQVILFNCQTDAFYAAMDDDGLTGSILSEIKLRCYMVLHISAVKCLSALAFLNCIQLYV